MPEIQSAQLDYIDEGTLLYPRFPQTFWSYDRSMQMAGLSSYSAFRYPYSCCTATKRLGIRFYDRNVNCETDADWEWCDIILSLCWLGFMSQFKA